MAMHNTVMRLMNIYFNQSIVLSINILYILRHGLRQPYRSRPHWTTLFKFYGGIMPAQKTGIESLTKSQATLYRSYVATNSKNTNQQKEITRLCELGKEGHAEIVAIAELLKANAERTATIKVQVSRAMAKLQTGLLVP